MSDPIQNPQPYFQELPRAERVFRVYDWVDEDREGPGFYVDEILTHDEFLEWCKQRGIDAPQGAQRKVVQFGMFTTKLLEGEIAVCDDGSVWERTTDINGRYTKWGRVKTPPGTEWAND